MNTIYFTKNINQLPAELLVQIFFLSGKQTFQVRYPHLPLSWVCRYWREIINGFGGFWTVIHFSPWNGEEFIRELVSRSRSAPLSVFSPPPHWDTPPEVTRINNILSTLDDLLISQCHRIELLFLPKHRHYKISNEVRGKVFSALKTFISKQYVELMADTGSDDTDDTDDTDRLEIIKSAKTLENLDISLSSATICSSLSELVPSFERLRNLKIQFSSVSLKRHFCLTVFPFCTKLESLSVSAQEYDLDSPFCLPSIITLPNLISLEVDCYTFIYQIRAPVLRRFLVSHLLNQDLTQLDYLIFDEYDVSSVTHLYINGANILSQHSEMQVRGIDGSVSVHDDPWDAFEHMYDQTEDLDLRGSIASSTFSSRPTQFFLTLPTHCTTPTPGIQHNSLLSRVLPKLLIEVLYITPCLGLFPGANRSSFHPSYLPTFRGFFKDIFDQLVSSKLRELNIKELAVDIDTLRLVFDFLNNYSLFSNLDIFTFGIPDSICDDYICDDYTDSVIRAFGEELLDSLRMRQKAGYGALRIFEMLSGPPLPKKCIAEAAIFGTHVIPHSFTPDDFLF